MKRLTFLLFAILVFASCEGPMGPMGPPGPSGDQGEPDAYWHSVNITINKWDLATTNDHFYANFSVPALTDYIYNNGVVVAYIETSGSYKTPLPYTRYNREPSVIPGEDDYLWSELIDFTYAPGVMTFYSNPSDFFTGIDPEPLKIKVVFVW